MRPEVSDIHCGPSMKEFCHCLLQNCSCPVPHFCAHHRCSVPVCSKQTISIMSSGCHDWFGQIRAFSNFRFKESTDFSRQSRCLFRVHRGPRSAVSNSNTQMVEFPSFQSILQLVLMNPWTSLDQVRTATIHWHSGRNSSIIISLSTHLSGQKGQLLSNLAPTSSRRRWRPLPNCPQLPTVTIAFSLLYSFCMSVSRSCLLAPPWTYFLTQPSRVPKIRQLNAAKNRWVLKHSY